MENSVGTFRTDRLMQGDRPLQVTVNTGSTVLALFLAAASLLCSFLKCFFGLVIYIDTKFGWDFYCGGLVIVD